MTYTNWKYVEEIEIKDGEKGIRATTPIPQDTIIGIYDGDIVEYDIEAGRMKERQEHKYIVQIACTGSKLYGLVSSRLSGIDFINHSCRPNIAPRDRTVLVAARPIEEGEVLTLDYTSWDFVPEGISCWCEPSHCVL